MRHVSTRTDPTHPAALIEPLTEIVIRAGAAILAVNRSAMKVDGKSDGSPVTEADLAADRIIADGLARLAPKIPSLSEERAAPAALPYRDSFFLIDPLDGTKEFVAGRNEFTVNLALVTAGNAAARHRRRAGARADLARHRRPRRGAADARRRASPLVEPIRTRPCPPHGAPGSWRSAACTATPGPRPLSPHGRAPCGAELGSAVKFGRVAEGAGRHLSPPVADLRMGRGGGPRGASRRPAAG